MMGFTEKELKELMKEQNVNEEQQEETIPIMRENYDGYKFSLHGKEKIYNSNMCLYFLNNYIGLGRMPEQLIDMNIASDYTKLGKMLDLCQGEEREKIIEKTVSGEGIVSEIRQKFNPAMEFTDIDLISMLFYLGYLTITGEEFGKLELKIPNKVMREIYSEYFMEILKQKTELEVTQSDYTEMAKEIAIEGKIDKIMEKVQEYLTNLSNRDYQKFDEKYVKLIFFCIAMNLKIFRLKSEMEIQRKYPDILLMPKDSNRGYKGVMIEFKYLKKGEEGRIKEKQEEAKKQIEEYREFDEIRDLKDIICYTVVAVNDKIYVEKI